MIDIGANLCHDSFDADREEVLKRAQAAGLEAIIVTGSCVQSSAQASELAASHAGFLYATAGIHPHHAEQVNAEAIEQLQQCAIQPQVVATGEMGLDFFRDFSPRPVQEKAFHLQLEWATKVGKPLFLHQREAHDRFLPILKDYLPQLPTAVVHCFTGEAHELRDYLDLDLYIGITGWICDERRGRHLWPLIREIAPERLLIETDAPYLLPRTIKPKPSSRRNEPMHLPAVVETIAELLNTSPESIATQTAENARRFFRLGEAKPT